MDIKSSLLKYDMLRNEQSVKADDENNKKVLNDLEIQNKINEVLSKLTEGTLTVVEATKELKKYGISSQLTSQNGNEVLNVNFQGKQYSAMATKIKARTTNIAAGEILDAYIKDRVITVAGKAVNGVINSAVKRYSITSDEYINTLITPANLSKVQIKSYLDDFALLLKKELSKNYSEGYLDSVLNFVKEETLSNLDTTLGVRHILRNFKDEVNEILTQDFYTSYEVRLGLGPAARQVKIIDTNVSPQLLINKKDEILETANAPARYLINLLFDTAEKLNLTDYEKKAFFQKVFDEVGKVVGNYEKGSTCIKFSKLSALDSNGDGSWLEEFHNIVINEASKVNPNVDRNPSEIDIKPFILPRSPRSFLSNLNEYLLHEDSGMRKFAGMIAEALDKFDCYGDDEKAENLVSLIFKYLNYAAYGNKSSNILNGFTIIKLNEDGKIFEKLEKFINDNMLETLSELGLDGDIDDFSQGQMGDCWLLAGLQALSSTPAGRNFISNAISYQEDKVVVTFAGVNKKVEISYDELKSFIDDENHSSGDTDVILVELAFKKLLGKIGNSLTTGYTGSTFFECFVGGSISKDNAAGIDDIFNLVGGLIGLSDGKVDMAKGSVKSFLEEIWHAKSTGKNFAATFAVLCSGNATFSWITTDGDSESFDMDTSGHVLAITDITSNTVTFANPWCSWREFTVSWSEFANIGIAQLSLVTF